MSDTQQTTARPAHHTPICPANLGCPECPEAPAVPATPRSRRAGQGSGSLGSAHPGTEGAGGRGPPSSAPLRAAQPSGTAALRRAAGHLRLRPRGAVPRQGSPPVSAARTPLPAAAGRQQGSRSAGAQGPGCARRLRPPWFRRSAAPAPTALRPQRLSVRRRRSWGEKREATEDAAGDRTAKRAPAAGGPVARRARVLLGNVVLPAFHPPSVSRATR